MQITIKTESKLINQDQWDKFKAFYDSLEDAKISADSVYFNGITFDRKHKIDKELIDKFKIS